MMDCVNLTGVNEQPVCFALFAASLFHASRCTVLHDATPQTFEEIEEGISSGIFFWDSLRI